MKTDGFDLAEINEKNIDIYVEPADDWHLYDDGYIKDESVNKR